MKLRTTVLLILLGLLTAPSASAQINLYISPDGDDSADGRSPEMPFRTLERARDAIRDLKKRGPVEEPVNVFLRGGEYPIEHPFRLTPADSGSAEAPVTYTNYEGETPIISGGRQIKGWVELDNGLWKVVIPEAKGHRWPFRQLYVNGAKRPRARTPNEGFFIVQGLPDGKPPEVSYQAPSRRFQFAPGDLDSSWSNLSDVEVIVYHFWTDSHLRIESIDDGSNIVTFQYPAGKVFTDDFTDDGARFIVENVLEELDQPGEWYLDRNAGVLYYQPLPGEEPSKLEVIAPFAPSLVTFTGNPESGDFVEHVTFKNLSFRYTHFELPDGNSNDRQGSASVTAAISLEGATSCTFTQCEFKNLGTYAFELAKGCSSNTFSANELAFIGGGGFRVNGGTAVDHPKFRTSHNRIEDNLIHHYGEEFPSSVGILLQHSAGNRIAHNEIHHGYYTAVSVGWSWGYQRSISRDNIIEFNHLHDIGQGLLSDMGGIYTLGVSPGTVLRNNWIHDVEANRYGGWGIYNDEGSTHILVENNLVHDTKFAGYDIHYAKEITVRNNIFAFGRLNQISRTRVEAHTSVYFENNIVYWSDGDLLDGNWTDPPYSFYFNPQDDDGTREIDQTFVFDWNIYYNPKLDEKAVQFDGQSFEEWRERGKDLHSLYKDPRFLDAAKRDFRLHPDSPAFQLGFKPIDFRSVGPRSPTGIR